MATVTSYTAERMKQIEDTAIVNGNVVGNDLMLISRDGAQINAGNVRGPQGIQGPMGATSIVPCTSTTRPTGATLFAGLGIYETDTKRFYIYNGSAWVYSGGVWICTSTTRPSSPFQGLEIYETDTKKKLIYNGVRFDPPWNSPWGIQAIIQRTTDAGPVGVADGEVAVSGMSISFTAVANRRLKITFEGLTFSQSGTDNVTTSKIFEDSNMLTTGGAWNTGPGYTVGVSCQAFRTPTAGAHTYSLKCSMSGTGAILLLGRSNSPMTLLIEDMGPNGVPA